MTKKIVDIFTGLILILVAIFALISLCSCGTAPEATIEKPGTETIITENIIVENTLTES